MIITIKEKEVELQYSYNSFRYMENLNIKSLEEMEDKPFIIIPVLEVLLLGAVNHNPLHKFSVVDVNKFLEKFIEDGSLSELLEELMDKLQKSNFFKSLQKTKKK